MSSQNTVGTRIKLARVARGLTQSELARAAGVAQSDISFIETNRQQPENTEVFETVLGVRFDHTDWERFFAMFEAANANAN